MKNTTATANAAYSSSLSIHHGVALVNNSISETFLSMSNGQFFYIYSWSTASDAHKEDNQGCYHFYEFYRGADDYGKVIVTSNFGTWIGRWDTRSGLVWMSSILDTSRFSLSGTTLTITT